MLVPSSSLCLEECSSAGLYCCIELWTKVPVLLYATYGGPSCSGSRAALPQLERADWGCIVFVFVCVEARLAHSWDTTPTYGCTPPLPAMQDT